VVPEPPAAPVAAIDCGTNSTRLLVAAADGAPLDRLMRITRLGQGVDAARKLDPEAVERTLAVLRDYRQVMDDLGVARARLVATSAVRDAVNGEEFLRAASETTRTQAELLSGTEEGRLAFAGATADLPAGEGNDVVVDIGGGSTELVISGPEGIEAVSLDLGCVRLTERYLGHDPPTSDELREATAVVDQELRRATVEVPTLGHLRPASRLIGLAGTVSTLASLELDLVEYDRSLVHHAVLTREAVERWCRVLAEEPSSARGRRPGMDPGREDVIVGGALVLRETMAVLDVPECLVSESDILDGLVMSLL
jgi:exopolyphosphatase/guanosine-5'-triphosphate,3'-diphosphate pyrophosphatase